MNGEKRLQIPVYALSIEESDQIGLALVSMPAMEEDFMFFSSEPTKMVFNEEKMMVVGPAIIPSKLIYRNDMLGERYVYFTEETIVGFVESFMSKEKNKFNLSHTDNYLNAVLIESYFAKEGNDFNAPVGSWIVGLKIKDSEVWEKVKSGEFKGFSIEGLFSNELVQLTINKEKQMSDLKTKISEALNKVLFPTEEVALEETEIVEEPMVDPSEDEVVIDEAFIDAKIAAVKEEIMLEVANMILGSEEGFNKQLQVVDEKVEQFGSQKVKPSIKEEVQTPKVLDAPKAAGYFAK